MPYNIQPCEVNFTKSNGLGIYQGSSWEVPITVCERNNLVDTPIDLKGYTAKCVIKKNLNDDTPIVTPTVSISEDVEGLFTISLSSSLTQNLITKGHCFHDIEPYCYEVRFNDGTDEHRALYGTVEVVGSCIDNDDLE